MKNKIKKVFKNRIFICILTALVTGTVSVCAVTYFPSNQVTYNNTTSGLKSSDVQGAIDELYSSCSSSMQSGDYIYYAVNSFKQAGSMSSGYVNMPSGASLYRCNIDGTNCSKIASSDSDVSFNNIYVTNEYMYYVSNSFDLSGGAFDNYVLSNGASLYSCNVDGSNCSVKISVSGNRNISNVYATDDYLYYASNSFKQAGSMSGGYVNMPSGASLYRCNIDGENCSTVTSSSGTTSIG